MNFDNYYPYTAEALPYELDALSPDISEYTLYFHHDKHYQGYVDKLNEMIKDSPLMQNIPLEGLTKIDDDDIRNNAGGIFNHELYFSSLTPNYREPSGKLKKKIEESFGSTPEMLKKMAEAAISLKGSGWVWLVENKKGKLEILTTKNQETIDFDKYTPLLAIDVWEHAYYLDRQNRRSDYIDAVIKLLNWATAENRLNDN